MRTQQLMADANVKKQINSNAIISNGLSSEQEMMALPRGIATADGNTRKKIVQMSELSSATGGAGGLIHN